MRSFLVALIGFTFSVQAATNLAPSVNRPVCLESQTPMGRAKLKLDRLLIRLETPDGYAALAQVVGVHKDEFYGNIASCIIVSNGLYCAGFNQNGDNFTLGSKGDRPRFQTPHENHFRLFKNKMQSPQEQGERIEIDNERFYLEEVDIQRCDEAIRSVN